VVAGCWSLCVLGVDDKINHLNILYAITYEVIIKNFFFEKKKDKTIV
jgi:hypothetical protein